jgi:hypothetical protein
MTRPVAAFVAVALLAVVWSAAPAQAAAPRLVMVSGAPLASPILLSDWDEIATLTDLLASGPAAPSDPRDDRPSLQLALFWNAGIWESYVREGRLGSLRPEQANQFGRFYPAVAARPALVDLPWDGTWPKQVGPEALAILIRHGVPTQLDGAGGSGVPTRSGDEAGVPETWWRVGGIVALGAVGALLVMRRRAAGRRA